MNHKALLDLILKKSFKHAKEPIFKLQSGKMSNYYIDMKQTTLSPQGLALIGEAVFNLVKDKDISAIGGLTLGADPIAVATSLHAFSQQKPLFPFVVRKEAKDHGTGKQIEAGFPFPAKVIILEDVLTSGASAMKALDACLKNQLEVKGVVTIIDRQEGGKEAIEKQYSLPVYSLFTKAQLFDAVL